MWYDDARGPRPESPLPTGSGDPRPPAPGQEYLGRTGGPGGDGGAGIPIGCSALNRRACACACALLPDIGARPPRLRPAHCRRRSTPAPARVLCLPEAPPSVPGLDLPSMSAAVSLPQSQPSLPPPARLKAAVRERQQQRPFIRGAYGEGGVTPAVRGAGRRAWHHGPVCTCRGPAGWAAAGAGRSGPRARGAGCTAAAPAAATLSCPRGPGPGGPAQHSLQGKAEWASESCSGRLKRAAAGASVGTRAPSSLYPSLPTWPSER